MSDLTHTTSQLTIETNDRSLDNLSSRKSYLKSLWNAIINFIDPDREPICWTKCDRHGNVYYQAYDPIGKRKFTGGSEVDLLIWLDESPRF